MKIQRFFYQLSAFADLWLLRSIVLLSLVIIWLPAQAQSVAIEEYAVKAALLYRFCLYVEWPPRTFASTTAPIVFGVAGPDKLAQEIASVIEGHDIKGRALTVRRIDDDPSLTGVQVLFIARSARERLPQLLAHARGLPLLVVTESPDALDAGSVINFELQNNRVRFDVSLSSTNTQGLHLSAQLLKVARHVQGREQGAVGL